MTDPKLPELPPLPANLLIALDGLPLLRYNAARAIVKDYAIAYARAAVELAGGGRDGERLDWMAQRGISIRQDPGIGGQWFLKAPYITGIDVMDNWKRHDSFRAAIDAAMTTQEKSN